MRDRQMSSISFYLSFKFRSVGVKVCRSVDVCVTGKCPLSPSIFFYLPLSPSIFFYLPLSSSLRTFPSPSPQSVPAQYSSCMHSRPSRTPCCHRCCKGGKASQSAPHYPSFGSIPGTQRKDALLPIRSPQACL